MRFFALCAGVSLLACNGTGLIGVSDENLVNGNAAISIHAMMAGVYVVAVDVEPAGLHEEIPYDATNDTFRSVFVVPAGLQTFTVRAFDEQGELVAEGMAEAEVQVADTTSVMVNVLAVGGSSALPDHGPIIESVVASKTQLSIGEATELTVRAFEPDGQPLSYLWTASCETGAFSDDSAAVTSWSANSSGVCLLTVTVSSAGLEASASVSVAALSQEGQASVEVDIVAYPEITRVELRDATGNFECIIERGDANGSCQTPLATLTWIEIAFDYDSGGQSAEPFIDTDCVSSFSSGEQLPNRGLFNWQGHQPGVCIISAVVVNDAGLSDTFPVAVLLTGTTTTTTYECRGDEMCVPHAFGIFQTNYVCLGTESPFISPPCALDSDCEVGHVCVDYNSQDGNSYCAPQCEAEAVDDNSCTHFSHCPEGHLCDPAARMCYPINVPTGWHCTHPEMECVELGHGLGGACLFDDAQVRDIGQPRCRATTDCSGPEICIQETATGVGFCMPQCDPNAN